MDRRDILAALTLAASVVLAAFLGLDAWILTVWAISLGALSILGFLGWLLVQEMRSPVPGRGLGSHVGAWISGGIAAFVSCTMAAALVRSGAPLRDFWLLGLLMLLAIVDLRLAYMGPRRR